MRRFCNRFFAEFGDSYTLLDVYNISEKVELPHAHYEVITMRPPSCSRPQPAPFAPTRSSLLLQEPKRCTYLHLSYLLVTTVAILPTKLVNATFLPRISFVTIVGKRDIKKVSILPSFWNGRNSEYHGKICLHLSLPLNQKPNNLSFPLMFCPPKVIPIRMLTRRSIMLTRRRCFKPMPFKFRLYKMNLNH